MAAESTAPGRESRLAAGELEFEERIGTGGFGTVFRARDAVGGGRFAVKVLHQPLLDNRAKERFLRECEALKRLADVPGVVTIRRARVDHDGRAFIVTDLFGATVADRLRSLGVLEPAEVIEIGRQVAGTLAATHDRGVIHGDLKPSNLFLGPRGQVMLGDFGAAALTDQTVDSASPISVRFSPPEVLDGQAPDEAADLYGLGATLHALATGQPPTIGGGTSLAEVPDGLAQLIRGLVSANPDLRPSSARQATAALDTLHQRGADHRAGPGDRHRWRSKRGAILGAAVAVGVAALGSVLVNGLVGVGDEGGPTGANEDQPSLTSPRSTIAGSPSDTETVLVEVDATDPPVDDTTDRDGEPGSDSCDGELCESFDAGIEDWVPLGTPGLVSFNTTPDGFTGPGLRLEPTEAAVGGGQSWIQNAVAEPAPEGRTSVRLRMRVDDVRGDDSWFQLLELLDENGRQWVVAAQLDGADQFRLTINHWDPLTEDGASQWSDTLFARGQWHCLELTVEPRAAGAARLLVDGTEVSVINETFDYADPSVYLVLLGPSWIEGRPPAVTVDDLVLTTDSSPTC